MTSPRPGAVLFEMVIALALFVAGAAMLTQLQTSVTNSLERARMSTEAADLARKALAELETGIITIADLRTMQFRTEQSIPRMDRRIDAHSEPSPWQLSVHTERSPYAGLTLVELTVAFVGESGAQAATRESNFAEATNSNEIRVTIRQLLRLREDLLDDPIGLDTSAESAL